MYDVSKAYTIISYSVKKFVQSFNTLLSVTDLLTNGETYRQGELLKQI